MDNLYKEIFPYYYYLFLNNIQYIQERVKGGQMFHILILEILTYHYYS